MGPWKKAEGFQIFNKPGAGGNRVAINFATGTVIETDGAKSFAVFIGGVRHVIAADDATLESLTGVPPEPGAAD